MKSVDMTVVEDGYFRYCIPLNLLDKFFCMLLNREEDLWIDFNATFEDYRISLDIGEYEK